MKRLAAICVLVSCLGFCRQASGQSGIITTVAGNGRYGSSGDGGPATSASLSLYSFLGSGLANLIAVDASGNLFIPDNGNGRIRKVSASGIITTVAGQTSCPPLGCGGFSGDGGPATSAALGHPFGVTVDASGNLYIADSDNNRIRKVSAGGIITTVAGNGRSGFSGDGVPATSASLTEPIGVAVDASGSLFIADTYNNRIRMVSASGIITTIAGNGQQGFFGDGGPAVSSALGKPLSVAVDASGNLFIADTTNLRIRKISANGIITTVAGNGHTGFSGDGGPATSAPLGIPAAVAVDTAGNLFIADSLNNRIREVSASGIITTVAGNGSQGFSGDGASAILASLNEPTGVAVDASGNLFIADYGNNRIREVLAPAPPPSSFTVLPANLGFSLIAGSSSSKQISLSGVAGVPWSASASASWITLTPTSGTGSGTISVAIDATSLQPGIYMASVTFSNPGASPPQETVTVSLTVTAPTIITTVAGNGQQGFSGDGGPATAASLLVPYGIGADAFGNLFIADSGNNRIRKVSAGGIITTVAGNGNIGFSGDGGPATSAQLHLPTGIAVDASGNLFIADFGNERIRKVSASGIITTVAGNGNSQFSGDGGPATSASLGPESVAVDAAGNLFIADTDNNRIRKVSAAGTITTVAGNGNFGFSGDGGPATSAALGLFSSGVAVDASGNLFIADTANAGVRKVSASGIITTVAGNGTGGFSGDGGPATSASLGSPRGVAVDASGNLFIVDANNRVRMVSANGIITTVAGSGPGYSGDGGPATAAQLFDPYAVAVDASGNLFIADTDNNRIREVSAATSTTLPAPSITAGGIVPVDSTVATIQPGEWVSIFGTNLASSSVTWNGNFPTSLGGTSVTINGKAAYLSFVSPTQINLQAPNDITTGSVPVVVTTASGTASSTVTLAQFGPSFLVLDSTHVAGIIPRSNGSGAFGGGAYDLLGPTGNSFGYPTVAAKAGDTIELFAVGLGPTNPAVPAGQAFSGAAAATNPVTVRINNVSVTPAFAGLSGAGLYQINLTVPAGLGTGDVSLVATVGGVQTPTGVVISLR